MRWAVNILSLTQTDIKDNDYFKIKGTSLSRLGTDEIQLSSLFLILLLLSCFGHWHLVLGTIYTFYYSFIISVYILPHRFSISVKHFIRFYHHGPQSSPIRFYHLCLHLLYSLIVSVYISYTALSPLSTSSIQLYRLCLHLLYSLIVSVYIFYTALSSLSTSSIQLYRLCLHLLYSLIVSVYISYTALSLSTSSIQLDRLCLHLIYSFISVYIFYTALSSLSTSPIQLYRLCLHLLYS